MSKFLFVYVVFAVYLIINLAENVITCSNHEKNFGRWVNIGSVLNGFNDGFKQKTEKM